VGSGELQTIRINSQDIFQTRRGHDFSEVDGMKQRKPRSKRYNVSLSIESYGKDGEYGEVQKWLKANIGNCIQDGHARYMVNNFGRGRDGHPLYSFAREEDAMMFALRWK
jgi:hypothetical protein